MRRTVIAGVTASILALSVACSPVPELRLPRPSAANAISHAPPPLEAVGQAPPFQEADDALAPNGLLSASRERLAVCVQVLADARTDEVTAVARIDAALRALATQLPWEYRGHPVLTAGFGFGPALVDAGCPAPPAALHPDIRLDRGKLSGGLGALVVPRASPYRVFVFVLAESEIAARFEGWPQRSLIQEYACYEQSCVAAHFAGSSRRTVTQELFCNGHTCAEVTTGVYFSAAELDDPAALTGALHQALGMELAP
jgi:hypothetical protein